MTFDSEVSSAIARVASETGVALDHWLIQAMIQSETGHQGSGVATNSSGTYYGPMNVSGALAHSLGFASPGDMASPASGIYAGARVLANMVRDFPGDIAAAISAYKVGPNAAVRDASGAFPNQDQVDLVTTIWNRYRRLAPVVAGGTAAVLLLVVLGAFLILRARSPRARAA